MPTGFRLTDDDCDVLSNILAEYVVRLNKDADELDVFHHPGSADVFRKWAERAADLRERIEER